MTQKKGFSHYVPVTLLIGMGFFTMGLMDPLYDSYVTIFLSQYIPYKWIVGLVMSLDNVLALFLIPLVSALSDNTRNALGRRMPWIITLLPLSALAFSAVPYAARISLALLITTLILLNIFKQSVRGPVVALMPDIVPPEYRSQGNGIINMMGNIAAIVGTLFLARLMDIDIILPVLGNTKNTLAFPAAGFLVIVSTILLCIFIREKHYETSSNMSSNEQISNKSENKQSIVKNITHVVAQKDKSALWILISLFLWFMGYQGVVPYITEFSINTFQLSGGQGPIGMGMVGISAAIAAVPMGYAASKWGRKRMIRLSLIITSIIILSVFFIHPLTSFFGIPASAQVYVFWACMFLFGAFWVSILANSFPMLWQMAQSTHIGVYTGLYYTFSQAAAILSPFLAGIVIDIVGHTGIFVYCALFFIAAFCTMGYVTGGEKSDSAHAMP